MIATRLILRTCATAVIVVLLIGVMLPLPLLRSTALAHEGDHDETVVHKPTDKPTLRPRINNTAHFKNTGTMHEPRAFHVQVLLSDGKVLVAGGLSETCEIYDPVTGTWSMTGPLSTKTWDGRMVLLKDRRVLICSGIVNHRPYTGAEIYDPATGKRAA